VVSNFAVTERYVQHRDALSIRVMTRAPAPHCFEMTAWVKWAAEQPLIAGTLATLSASLITYVVSRAFRQRQEMRLLKESLETAIRELGHRDQPVVDRLLDTIDKMAEALKPAVRQAAKPVGDTVSSLTIGRQGSGSGISESVTISRAERDAMFAEEESEVTDEQTYHVLITEIDVETGSCKVSFIEEDAIRVAGKITDPALNFPRNAYAMALAERKPISVRGKAVLRGGEIKSIYISNTSH